MMKPTILKKRSDFVCVNKNGSRAKTVNIISLCLKIDSTENVCVGFTASKKIGNAVVRNLAKRRLRHLVRLAQNEFLPGFYFVFIATMETAFCKFTILLDDFIYCIRQSMNRASKIDVV